VPGNDHGVISRLNISIIIPVLNEESGINTSIRHIRQISSEDRIEIIVVDGDAGGSTIRSVADAGAQCLISPPGRGKQMNCGARAARGEILLFLHADTLLPRGSISLVRKVMRSGRYQAGAFGLDLDSRRIPLRIIAAAARLRIRLSGIPFGDQGLFMRRDYFHRIGGYAEIPLMEDVEIAQRIKKLEGRIIIVPERVLTSVRKWEEEGVLYSIFRNWFIQLSYFLGVPPERLVKIYYSSRA